MARKKTAKGNPSGRNDQGFGRTSGSVSRFFIRYRKAVATSVVVLVLIPLLVTGLTSIFDISESRIEEVLDDADFRTELITEESYGREAVFRAVVEKTFTNEGMRAGHIEECRLVHEGVHKIGEIQVLHVDRTRIAWLDKESVRCEFLITVPSSTIGALTSSSAQGAIPWVVYYYDQLGRQVSRVEFTLFVRQK